ncbi:TIGR04086 family membrane protein [Lottiidibacillus patelloidae]|uniref:TIGR04086 family membrane protein n=2 Tax=Lottiidibacillus patelloidae TaxID=2670334 RepID=A0A263BW91_9BACI|nr:TIGR04086 family membrane protein [Lottiidibacillus patelloidae]
MGYGLLTILILIISASLIISLLLKFTSLEEGSFNWLFYALTFITLFIGGFISGGKAKEKGWMIGLGTGLLYTLVVFFVQYLGYQDAFSMEQYVHHGTGILSAMFGGMLGVNVAK